LVTNDSEFFKAISVLEIEDLGPIEEYLTTYIEVKDITHPVETYSDSALSLVCCLGDVATFTEGWNKETEELPNSIYSRIYATPTITSIRYTSNITGCAVLSLVFRVSGGTETAPADNRQDFLTYTETDPSSMLAVSKRTATAMDVVDDVNCCVHHDFGASYFGDFVHDIDVICQSIISSGGFISVWSIGNGTPPYWDNIDGANNGLTVYFYWETGYDKPDLYLEEPDAGSDHAVGLS
jgi:hypothetical protein